MHARTFAASLATLALLLASGCGDGSEAVEAAKASTFTGDWIGTYAMSGTQTASGVAFRLDNLTGVDANSTVFGSIDSQYVAGSFAGTVDDTGTVVGIVENDVDGTTWAASMAKTGNGISLDLFGETGSITGLGEPSPPHNGLIHYKTTIKNTTNKPIDFSLFTEIMGESQVGTQTGLGFYARDEGAVTLQPGESHTYETGNVCPWGFKPWLIRLTDPMPFPETACSGKPKDVEDWFWPCCRSSSWEIRATPVMVDGNWYDAAIVRL